MARPQNPISAFIMLEMGPLVFGNAELTRGSKDPFGITNFKIRRLNQNTNAETEMDASYVGSLFETAEFNITIMQDPTIESQIVAYHQSAGRDATARFRYGYVNGPKSIWYTGMISSFGLSSDMKNIKIVLTWKSPGSNLTDLTSATIQTVTSKEYNRYSDVVTDVATNQGWKIGHIEPTKQISEIIYPQASETPFQYISKIIGKCEAEDGSGRYVSEFRPDSSGGDASYYFRPTSCKVSGTIDVGTQYEFTYGALPTEEVLSFTPKLTDGVALLGNTTYGEGGDTNNSFGTISKDTKEVISMEYSAETSGSNASGTVLNSNSTVISAAKTGIDMSTTYEDSMNYTLSTVKGHLNEYVYSTSVNPEAEIQVIGNPDIQLMDYINILAMYPPSFTNTSGMMHPSSGTYMVTSIIDSISGNGLYTTTMSLVKENNSTKVTSTPTKSVAPPMESNEVDTIKYTEFKQGDKVYFTGSKHYMSANPGAREYGIASQGFCELKMINERMLTVPGAHPYNLVHYGDWTPDNSISGWVNEGDFEYREDPNDKKE